MDLVLELSYKLKNIWNYFVCVGDKSLVIV